MLKMYKQLQKDQSAFFCFTPIVTLLTFIAEFSLAFYVIFRYKLNKFNRLVVLLLLLLGTFQLAEYMICRTQDVQLWARIGAASITILPALGLHLVSYMTRPTRWLQIGYCVGIAMVLGIMFYPSFAIDTHCTGKFVILDPNTSAEILHTIYYLGFLLIAVLMLLKSLKQHKGNRKELTWMLIAYLSFIIPTALIYLLFALSLNGIPSIMCGFAIILALILVFKEVPRFSKINTKKAK